MKLEQEILKVMGRGCPCELPETCDMCEWKPELARDLAERIERSWAAVWSEDKAAHYDSLEEMKAAVCERAVAAFIGGGE